MAARLDFEIDSELGTGLITGHAGVPGLIEAFRGAVGGWGERAEELDQFRQDKALALLLGHDLPPAQTARDFLAQFHAEDLPLLQEGKATVPAESAPPHLPAIRPPLIAQPAAVVRFVNIS